MRFFVHVTPIGKVETQSYCVEADSWQKALQNARTLRRETAPITGFSIELTDDGGCRAVDPAARLRYVVKRAPDTAVLTPGVLTPEASGPTRNSAFTKTIGYGTATRSSSSQIPPHPDATQAGMPGMIEDPHVLYRREQEPTEESPLLYREDVYVMAEGTSEAQAEKYLRAQFLTIKAVLASSGPGKYVNLAVYDRAFEGRPTILPLATLSWKDWKGQDPTVVHPRSGARHSGVARGEIASARVSDSGITVSPVVNVAPVPAAAAVPVPVPVAQPAAPPPAGPPPAIAALGEALRRASQPPPAPSPPIPTRASAPSVPNPAASVQAAGGRASADPLGATVMAESAPAFPPPARAPQRSAFVSTPEPRPVAEYGLAPSDPQARISSTGRGSTRPSRPSATGPRGRLRGDELIGVLFESMHDLHFSRDALEAAEFCLQLAVENLPSRAAFAHFYDVDKREYVIVAAVGAGTQPLILRHHATTDPLLSAAMRKRAAVVLPNAAGSEDAFVERFEVLGGARSVIVAPVMLMGRALAAIELLNPSDGAPYTDAEGNALTYMGEQFGEYVSSHGLVLDPDRIRRRHNQS